MDNHLGEWLADLRKRRELTQVELSQATGVSERTIQRYENGETEPAADFLLLLDALGVKMDPAPPNETPHALNVEVHEIAALIDEVRDGLKSLRAEVRRVQREVAAIRDHEERQPQRRADPANG